MTRSKLAAFFLALLSACGGSSSSSDPNPNDPPACGGSQEACCATDPVCDLGLTCQSGTCKPPPVACGGDGEACCAAIVVCDPGLTCSTANVCGVPPPPPCTDPYLEAPSFAINAYPESIASGDVDADGDLDLVVCGNPTYFLKNDGTGSFVSSVSYALATDRAVVVDLDGDGKDEVVLSNNSNKVFIMQGPGPATTGWKNITTGNGTIAIAPGDLNRDGKMDLVTASEAEDSISVHLGNGDLTFAAKVDHLVESSVTNVRPTAVAIGDLNGDTWPDIAVASYQMSSLAIFLNSGAGTFGAPTLVPAASRALDLAAVDLNGDGHLDLAMPRAEYESVVVLLGNGDGTFGAGTWIRAGQNVVAIEAGDLDGAGGPDLVTLSYDSAAVGILSGLGDGTFGPIANHTVAREPSDVALGDFDGDGDQDVAVASYRKRFVQVFRNDGVGGLGAPPYAAAGAVPDHVASGRFDADLLPDLVVTNTGANTVSVLLGQGGGRLAAPVALATGAGPSDVAVGDVDGDGKDDLVTANFGAGTVSFLRGAGDGTFLAKVDTDAGGGASSVAIGDFDGDGDGDVLVASNTDATTYLLESNGDGTLAPKVTVTALRGSLQAADVDADGKLDLVLFASGAVQLLLGNGDGTFGTPIPKWTTAAYGLGEVTSAAGLEFVAEDPYSYPSVVRTWNRTTGTTYTSVASRQHPAELFAITLPDATGDGKAEITMQGVLLNVGINAADGTDLATASYATGYLPKAALAVDLDGDGRDDLVVPTEYDGLRVMMSVCE
jgi:hypothetical protein